jgi:hypothetical protein
VRLSVSQFATTGSDTSNQAAIMKKTRRRRVLAHVFPALA